MIDLALLLAALLAPQAETLDARLARAARIYGDKGYAASGWSHRGSLATAGLDGLTVPLQGGRSYQIVGACAGECDLDLQLLDAGGRQADIDEQADDLPMVATAPAAGQGYVLRVTMGACAADPCDYVVKAFVK